MKDYKKRRLLSVVSKSNTYFTIVDPYRVILFLDVFEEEDDYSWDRYILVIDKYVLDGRVYSLTRNESYSHGYWQFKEIYKNESIFLEKEIQAKRI